MINTQNVRSSIQELVINRYTLDDQESEMFLEDAGVSKTEAQELLTNLFFTRLLFELASTVKAFDENEEDLSVEGIVSHIAKFATDAKEIAEIALTYRCYEPWKEIIHAVSSTTAGITEEKLIKAVNYLYDGYDCD